MHFDKGFRVAEGKTAKENDLKGKRSLRVSPQGLTSVESSRFQVVEAYNNGKCMEQILWKLILVWFAMLTVPKFLL